MVNGENHELHVQSIQELVLHFKLKPNLIIAEVDGEIVDRDSWSHTPVKDGTKIELVEFIAGG
nr:sulfur carrier protein ThiS [Salipaludibacillus keqinensis]